VKARLVLPGEAAAAAVAAACAGVNSAVCAEVLGAPAPPLSIALRPAVRPRDRSALGYGNWQAWADAWHDVAPGLPEGVELLRTELDGDTVPSALRLMGLDAALALARAHRVDGAAALEATVASVRHLAAELVATGGMVTPENLRDLAASTDHDAAVALAVTGWLADHEDLGSWSMRQLPVPGMPTKWPAAHAGLVLRLTGRDLRAETRARPAVAHVTYVDAAYRAAGLRAHDAWTAGDAHEPAYQPRVVLVVENRDCRLWFPPFPDTVVVEGGGKAASALLADVAWVRAAETVVYWGDIDAEGFAILDHFRAAMAERQVPVRSILMDGVAFARYAELGVSRDERGHTIASSRARLVHLEPDEVVAYTQVATAGPQPVRRIEQERIPLDDAVDELRRVVLNV